MKKLVWAAALLLLCGCETSLPEETLTVSGERDALIGKRLWIEPGHALRLCATVREIVIRSGQCAKADKGAVDVLEFGEAGGDGKKYYFVKSAENGKSGWVEAIWIAGASGRLTGAVSPTEITHEEDLPVARPHQKEVEPRIGMTWYEAIRNGWGMPPVARMVQEGGEQFELWDWGARKLYLKDGTIIRVER